MIGLVVEYGVIKPFWEADGRRVNWSADPSATVPGTRAYGDVWVGADHKVHVSGTVEDVEHDSASAQVMLIGRDSAGQATAKWTDASAGAGDRSRINHSDKGQVFNEDTVVVDVAVCTINLSRREPPRCAGLKQIYNVETYEP